MVEGGGILDKYIEQIVKRGNSHYIRVSKKTMDKENLNDGDYVIVDLKKVEL